MRCLPIAAIVAAIWTIALTQIASAADEGTPPHKARVSKTPVYKALPPPAPVYSWTGFYVGGNLGGSWGNANTDLAGNGSGATNHPGTGSFSFTFAGSNKTELNGVIGGGQIGYNYQFSPNGVLGFEADIQGSGERGSGQFAVPFTTLIPTPCVIFCPPSPTTPLNGAALTGDQDKIEWFGTVRGRLGFLVGDQLLVYGTGGLAYGRVAVSGGSSVSATQTAVSALAFTPTTAAFGASKINVGFAVGGGMEGRFSYWLPPNWTWKLEYLFLDLGSIDTPTTSFVVLSSVTGLISNITGNITTHTHFTDNIVRVGLNYRFGNYFGP